MTRNGGPGGAFDPGGPPGGRLPERPARSWRQLHIWEIQAIRDLLVISAIAGLIWLGYVMRAVTTPLLIALALAYLFEPLISRATERYRVSRPVVVGGLLAALFGLLTLVIVATAPLVVRQVSSMVDDVRTGRMIRAAERFEDVLPEALRGTWRSMLESTGLLDEMVTDDPSGSIELAADTAEDTDSTERVAAEDAADPDAEQNAADGPAGEPDRRVRGATPDYAQDPLTESEEARVRRIVIEELDHRAQLAATPGLGRYLDLLRRGVGTASTALGVIISAGLLAFLIPFYFFFFSVSYPAVLAFGESLLPRRHRDQALDLLRKMDSAVAGFVRGRLVISMIMSVLLAVGWYICGVPYSIVLGIVIGVFNLVPYLSGIGLPIALALLAFEQLGLPADQRMSWFWILAGPTIVFAVTQIIDGYVLTPIIAGKATDLDPVTILVAVLAGGSLAGFYGMLLAIPVAACLKIVIREILLPRVRAWTAGRASDPLPM